MIAISPSLFSLIEFEDGGRHISEEEVARLKELMLVDFRAALAKEKTENT
ncbi:MAG: hypothetical protein Q7R75_01095 [bacterium]|nr:hypothetical protein [bacterium]